MLGSNFAKVERYRVREVLSSRGSLLPGMSSSIRFHLITWSLHSAGGTDKEIHGSKADLHLLWLWLQMGRVTCEGWRVCELID
jgi:hypothetical protein